MTAPVNSLHHTHVFNEGNPLAERNIRWALGLTLVVMVIEIIGGWAYNSMALLADGWHMSSHALALGLSVLAYAAARRLAHDSRFSFGTWKIEILGGYTSAILLVGVAVLMLFQSIERLFSPTNISYDQAILIAVVGLVANLACAWLLNTGYASGHVDDHDQHHEHQDMNLRAAYLHVITDAATSVLAIVALLSGKFWGAAWLDPIMGILGAILITLWAVSLIRSSGRILLDAEMDAPVVEKIREVIAASEIPAEITDLHVWRVGKDKYACIVAVSVTSSDAEEVTPEYFRKLISVHEELAHVTVEINPNH